MARARAPSGCSASGVGDGLRGSQPEGRLDPPCSWVPDLPPPLQGAVCPPLRMSYRMAALIPVAAASPVHLLTSTFRVIALSLWALGACWAWGGAVTVPMDLGACSDY